VASPTPEFLADLKARTEARWARTLPDPSVLGFQFAQGTRWLRGLSPAELASYEEALAVSFPEDLRALYRAMNGTDPAGVYSYPRDLDAVRARAAEWRTDWFAIRSDLAAQGAKVPEDAVPVPLFGHRGLLRLPDGSAGPVLSIVPGDAVVYAPSLREWLELELL
jgi:hypothetical protein